MEQPNAELTETEIEQATAMLQHRVQMGEALAKLMKNKEFKKIILESYLEQGAINTVRNLGKIKEEYKDQLVKEMEARSGLWKHLDKIQEDAESAKLDLQEL